MKRTQSLLCCLLLLLMCLWPAAAADMQGLHTLTQNALLQLQQDTPTPVFSPVGGDWVVFSLARAGLIQPDDTYTNGYYERIVQTVRETAPSVSLQNGALHPVKSTENARLILALTAIGRDPRQIGGWDLLQPFADFNWVKRQGVNAVAYALLALDSHSYEPADSTIRTQCIDHLLQKQTADGGWTLYGDNADSDITAIVLQGLAAYRERPDVAATAARAIECLSAMQLETGGFATGDAETTESAAQVLLALCAWQIDAAADARFLKDGTSVLDALLAAYLPQQNAFRHRPAQPNADEMATQQATLALLAYEHFQNGQPFLFDCTDVPLTADPTVPEPETETTESAESTKESTDATVPAETTEASAVTAQPTEPAPEGSGDSTKETTAEKETTAPATTQEAAPRPAATTAPPAPTADRTEATPHTGDDPVVFAAIGLLALSAAALALSRKKEARHAS